MSKSIYKTGNIKEKKFIEVKEDFKIQSIKITTKEELKFIILSGKFDNAIQVKNNEHICQDGSIYDYSSITDISWMFHNCSNLQTIPLFDTSNITDMSRMFSYCLVLTHIPLLDTSNVTDASRMFYNCIALKNIPLLDTSNVTNMQFIFAYCISLTTIPKLNNSNVIKLDDKIFSYCQALQKIEKIKFFYQKNKILLKNLELNPRLFSEQKLDELLFKFKKIK
jgi:surface protein